LNLTFRIPSEKEFAQICGRIREFELDGRGLQREQFTAAFRNAELVGFGRLREHPDCIELCSLGVVASQRRKGIGKALVAELTRNAPSAIHLSCIIPEFFIPAGFRITKSFPASMREKLNYCSSELPVPETYVVMVLEK
jgi:N-acetylglutamate synthase-like GNAT family acetyltransferase